MVARKQKALRIRTVMRASLQGQNNTTTRSKTIGLRPRRPQPWNLRSSNHGFWICSLDEATQHPASTPMDRVRASVQLRKRANLCPRNGARREVACSVARGPTSVMHLINRCLTQPCR